MERVIWWDEEQTRWVIDSAREGGAECDFIIQGQYVCLQIDAKPRIWVCRVPYAFYETTEMEVLRDLCRAKYL